MTWQDADEMADRARSVDADESIGSDTDWNDGTSELMVANEYGQVVLERRAIAVYTSPHPNSATT